jgi:hypothetical protein
MKARKFNNSRRYTIGEEEHDRDCECGACLAFVDFLKKRLYGDKLTTRAIRGESITVVTREDR